jgi:hypothetical protein
MMMLLLDDVEHLVVRGCVFKAATLEVGRLLAVHDVDLVVGIVDRHRNFDLEGEGRKLGRQRECGVLWGGAG